MNKEAVQHERGPRNSTIRRQVALYLKESSGPSFTHIPPHLRPLEAHLNHHHPLFASPFNGSSGINGHGHSLGHHPNSLFRHPLLSEEQASAIFSAARLPFSPFFPPTPTTTLPSPTTSPSSPPTTRLDSRNNGLTDTRTNRLSDSGTNGRSGTRTSGLSDSRTTDTRTNGLLDTRTNGLLDTRTNSLSDRLSSQPIPWHTLFPRMTDSSLSPSTSLSSLLQGGMNSSGGQFPFPILPVPSGTVYSHLSPLEQYAAHLWRESILRGGHHHPGATGLNGTTIGNIASNGLTTNGHLTSLPDSRR